MPRVPYTPYPTEEARSGGTGASSFNPAVPDVAFGTSIARATQQAGAQLESSGNEMFSTALGLQRMANETAAKDADVAFTADLAKLQTQYETTEGVNAQAGLDKHIKDVQALRQQYLDKAKGPEQRLMFANSVDRRTGYAIVDAGRHAATQTKKANDDATEARLKSGIEFADVTNPEKFKAGINQTISETQAKGRDKGWKPEKLDAETRDNVSKYLTQALKKHSPVNPEETLDRFNEVKDWLRDDDRDFLQKTIDRDIAVKSSSVEAQKILGDDPLKNVAVGKEGELLEKAEKLADSDRYKDNPDFRRLLESRIRGSINLARDAKRDTDLKNMLTIKDFVHGQDWQHKISSIDGVAGPGAPPEIRDAYGSLDRNGKDMIDNYIRKENKLSIPDTPERRARFAELTGMAQNDKAKFANLPLLNEDKLSWTEIKGLIQKQAAIAGRVVDDPHISQYLSWANKPLATVGIGPSSTDEAKATQYDHFTGRLINEVKNYEDLYKKPPDIVAVREMTQRLMEETVFEKGRIWDTKGRRFEFGYGGEEVPQRDIDAIQEVHQKNNPGAAPLSKDQVTDWYRRGLEKVK